MAFELPKLRYAYEALEPHIDAKTMEIHFTKHHAAYVNNLNAALQGTGNEDKTPEEIMSGVSRFPVAVRNNGGGHFNHTLFWEILSPNGGGIPSGDLADAINRQFSSFDKLKELISNAGLTRFGSGWAWLVVKGEELVVTSTPNQDNPLMDVAEVQGTPILGIDVWEHAYYLKYQNRRNEYLAAIWNVLNWEEISRRFKLAIH